MVLWKSVPLLRFSNHVLLSSPVSFPVAGRRGELEAQKAKIRGWGMNSLLETAVRKGTVTATILIIKVYKIASDSHGKMAPWLLTLAWNQHLPKPLLSQPCPLLAAAIIKLILARTRTSEEPFLAHPDASQILDFIVVSWGQDIIYSLHISFWMLLKKCDYTG